MLGVGGGDRVQRRLCSGASVSDSAEEDPSETVPRLSGRSLKTLDCAGDLCLCHRGLGWSRLPGDSYATRRAASRPAAVVRMGPVPVGS